MVRVNQAMSVWLTALTVKFHTLAVACLLCKLYEHFLSSVYYVRNCRANLFVSTSTCQATLPVLTSRLVSLF